MSWSFADAPGGTEVTVLVENAPPGIAEQDHLRPVGAGGRDAANQAVRRQHRAIFPDTGLGAFVDLSGKKWEPGLYDEPLKLQLPREFQLAQNPPRPVSFQLLSVEAVRRYPNSEATEPQVTVRLER